MTNNPRFTTIRSGDGADETSQGGRTDLNIMITIVITLCIFACGVSYALGVIRKRQEAAATPPPVIIDTSEDEAEKIKRRQEWIARSLVVKVWIPRETAPKARASSGGGIPPHSSGKDAHELPAPQGNSTIVDAAPQREIHLSRSFGTDDSEFFSARKSDCPICLATLDQQELVCESNNPLRPHVYHKMCIEGWLMQHDECPMCRHIHLLETEELGR